MISRHFLITGFLVGCAHLSGSLVVVASENPLGHLEAVIAVKECAEFAAMEKMDFCFDCSADQMKNGIRREKFLLKGDLKGVKEKHKVALKSFEKMRLQQRAAHSEFDLVVGSKSQKRDCATFSPGTQVRLLLVVSDCKLDCRHGTPFYIFSVIGQKRDQFKLEEPVQSAKENP